MGVGIDDNLVVPETCIGINVQPDLLPQDVDCGLGFTDSIAYDNEAMDPRVIGDEGMDTIVIGDDVLVSSTVCEPKEKAVNMTEDIDQDNNKSNTLWVYAAYSVTFIKDSTICVGSAIANGTVYVGSAVANGTASVMESVKDGARYIKRSIS